ncbi:MAG: cytochrome c-type biogenesis protein CcmH [Acidimicrobiales bacterium]
MAHTRRPSTAARRVPWLVLLVVLAAALALGSRDDGGTTAEDRVTSIAATIKCPLCAGQSAATSDAATATAIRADIARRLDQGQSPDRIRDYYASRYDDILLTPGRSGAGGLVWAIPVVAVAAAFTGLAFAFRRWQGVGGATPTAADRVLVAAALRRERSDEHGEGEGR